jgi:hypothetical protein
MEPKVVSSYEVTLDWLKGAMKQCRLDLAALGDEGILKHVGGVSRRPVDYMHEVAYVNQRITQRIQGNDPGPWPHPDFVVAPEDYVGVEKVAADVEASVDALVAAAEARGRENWDIADIPAGEENWTTYTAVFFAAYHLAYHVGQLNMQQAALGDNDVHWS